MDGLVTVEFYEDTLHVKMIGAVYLEQKRMIEGLELIGRAICKARKMNVVECAILDGNGNLVDNTVVYRGR